ncbi:hypothetical protein [Hymenobacter metallicola]|uniref:Uncharacterized protein n=1 Tax=Hymenobacter metallicola TaxID=2563114 RepID=A0A4Z0QJI7_9BACT|nr:hypothetical protein [Hymenobacter metallicola]TGE29453.1 hypothetical protein E5K02_08370 [Hymenobacter metallicola]
MHTRARYTIGYLTGGYYTPKSGKRYSYRYEVRGQEYEATDIREVNMNTATGARFVVEYDSLDPGVSRSHFALAVPDSIGQAPANGWKVPPFITSPKDLNYGREEEARAE